MTNPDSSLPKRKVLIVDSSQENRKALTTWFEGQPDFELVGVFHSPNLALKAHTSFTAEFALVGIDMPNGIKLCKILRKRNPSICIIALIQALNPEMQVAIRQAGAIESLARTASQDLIGQTIRSVTAIEGSTLCSIVGIGGIKEGVGTTLLTGILGDFLGKRNPKNVLLADLDFRRGDLAFSLGQSGKKSIQELVALEDFLHAKVLQSFITVTPRGFSMLSAAQEPNLQILSDIAFVGLLTVLGNFYEVIFIDLPPFPFTGLAGVIDICDTVIINTGEYPNQLKSLFRMVASDLKKLPESYTEKLLFTSWCMEPKERAEVEAVVPQCMFLPRPRKAMFSDPAFSINDGAEFQPLRAAIGSLLEKIPGLSLFADLDSSSQDSLFFGSAATNPILRFFQSILGK